MVSISFLPMALEPKQFSVGDTIKVTVSFQYTVAVQTTVTLRAVPYQKKTLQLVPIHDPIESCAGTASITLSPALTPTSKTASVNFTLIPAANGGIANGTYGLRVEVPEADERIDLNDVLIVSGNPPSIIDMIPMLMMVMMLGMVVPMLGEGEGMEI